jgi:exosome complex exonuclease DIS3/RRP44
MEDNQSTQHVFFRRNRRGKVQKLVRERYLRDDLDFGYRRLSRQSIEDIRGLLDERGQKSLLVVDTNVALQEIDLLEFDSTETKSALSVVVILETVLKEVKHLNLSAYRRLKTLVESERKSFVFFPNEVSRITQVEKESEESINDANDRAIRVASLYYKEAIGDSHDVIMLTKDKDNKRKARESELNAMGMREYLLSIGGSKSYPQLMDLLSSDGSSGSMAKMSVEYPSHLSIEDINERIRNGKLFKGTIRCKGRGGTENDNWTDCYAVIHSTSPKGEEGERRSAEIKGEWRVNRALDGDVVALELVREEQGELERRFQEAILQHGGQLYPSSQGEGAAPGSALNRGEVGDGVADGTFESLEGIRHSSEKGNDQEGEKEGKDGKSMSVDSDEEESGETPGSNSSSGPGQLHARVVGIIRRNWRKYAGSLDMRPLAASFTTEEGGGEDGQPDDVAENRGGAASYSEAMSYLFVPVDKKMPRIGIEARDASKLDGQRFLVGVDSWPEGSMFPLGHFVQSLGPDGDKDVETKVLLHEFDVPYESFTSEVMACLPPSDWKITEDIVALRTDLRHIPVVSIDPPGCKDIDDALHCIRLPNGRLEAGVHIADVTHFVKPDTAIDKEASHRATSTYLVERRLDMLPSLLTTELCSLRSKEDHLAFSVIWEFDDDGNIHDVRFFKSVIHSVASLTYGQAQDMLDSPHNGDDQVACSVKLLNKLALILRQRRIEMGALTLASPEVRFKFEDDGDDRNPTDVAMYQLKQANALVEEWMLLANITVSKKILRHYPTLGLLRRHQPPSKEQFRPLIRAASAAGVTLDVQSSKTLADSLDLAVKERDPYFNKLLRIMSTRCMMPAQYFCSGEIPKEYWHHYGLAAPVYTHFTSPIRRYADVVVHRLLAAAIGEINLPPGNADRGRQQELSSHLNRRHKAAQYVQRASVQLYTLLYFKNRPSVETAYVLALNEEKILVLAPKFGVEAGISIESQLAATGATAVRRLGEEEVGVAGADGGGSATAHTIHFVRRGGTTSSSAQEEVVLALSVFQQVSIHIRVVEGRAGDRFLDVSLALDGQEPGQSDEKKKRGPEQPPTGGTKKKSRARRS